LKKSPSHKSRQTSRKAPRAGKGSFRITQKLYKGFPPKKTYDKGKGKPPKWVRDLVKDARRYKERGKDKRSALSRKLNKRLEAELKGHEYTPEYIKKAKGRRISGKLVFLATAQVTRYYGRYRYKGKFISQTKAKRVVRMLKYNALIKHYKDVYGLSHKEAQVLWRGLRDAEWGQQIFKALY